MELEEAIQWLNDFTNIIAINKQYTIKEGRLTKVQEAIEKVLKALEITQQNYELAIMQNISYKQNIYDLKHNSIPKKKIKDLLEEVYIDEGMGYELDKDEKPGAVRVLIKLLEDK